MNALVKRSGISEDAGVGGREIPRPPAGHVLVRTEACGLCGSDVHAWRQDAGYDWVRTPVTLGHEAIGEVVAAGPGADRGWVGRRVVPVSIDGCGDCPTCREGLRQICPDRTVLGLSFDGAAAEHFTIDQRRLVPVEVDLPASTLVLTEPLSVALRAVKHLERAEAAHDAVVSGPGPIGLMIALLLRQRGHRVVLVGAERDRRQRLAVAASLGLETRVAGESSGTRPGGWVEASGSSQALNAAVHQIRSGGTVVVPALFGGTTDPDVNVLTRNEIRLQGSYGSLAVDYRDAMSTLAADPEPWSSLVTTFPLSEGVRALETAAAAEVFKAVLVP
ncbi:alcohol dehydrogenase catalytic domain-containing protein [Saccharopolyspora sp. NPDC049426]|uniref:zinc-dependent alcohol dehydrogenase n=1 Tax=Saccharopolyspora sp. NPDC049426 TaxID=3155652 RepID=UPI0034283D09